MAEQSEVDIFTTVISYVRIDPRWRTQLKTG
jgi:hypothetical protein